MNKTALVVILCLCLIGSVASNFVAWDGDVSFPKMKVSMLTIIYLVIGISILLNVIAFTTAAQETKDAMKRWWAKIRYKAVFSRIEFINPDSSCSEIYVRTRESKLEYNNLPFFINPKKGIRKRGVNTFTFVNKNTFGHDFISDPKEILTKIIEDCKALKTVDKVEIKDLSSDVHEIWAEPYRYDARMVKEALTNAQLSAAQQLDALIKLFSNKNIITIGMIILGCAAAAALFSFMANNHFQDVQMCTTVAKAASEGVFHI